MSFQKDLHAKIKAGYTRPHIQATPIVHGKLVVSL